MSVVLARIDDRLIHGQVAVGWVHHLKADSILVLDDEAASDPWERDLVCASSPDPVRAEVHGVRAGVEEVRRGSQTGRRLIVLMRSVRSAVEAVRSGLPVKEINVGGLHHRPGTRSVLPYVYLDEKDESDFRTLAALGIKLWAQDLPGNRGSDLLTLLDRDAK
jgi:PTS system N-acetylgalactosamine-specific IIB component